jgi:hypothetical protein
MLLHNTNGVLAPRWQPRGSRATSVWSQTLAWSAANVARYGRIAPDWTSVRRLPHTRRDADSQETSRTASFEPSLFSARSRTIFRS